MKWLAWLHRHPDPDEARRAREKAARAMALERQSQAAIANAQRSARQREHVIRENHLAPKIAAALRENR